MNYRLALVAIVCVLAACAKPMTSAPKLEASQVAAERAEQQRLLEASKSGQVAALQDLPETEVVARLQRVATPIQVSGTAICQQMYGSNHPCSYEFGLANQDVLNAWADGKGVYITPKMVSFTQSDEELANILAHEYAHNILKHPQATGQNAAAGAIGGMLLDVLAQSQGMETGGQFSKLGANAGQYHYSVDFEKEADYVGLYILARAGFSPQGAGDFWRRFTLQDPNGLYGSRSHPSNPERTVSMKKTADEIMAKSAAGQPLLPTFRQK